MRQEGVGDPGEPAPCVGVVDRDRLVGAVPAREDERRAEVGTEEVVQRRVGEQQSDPGRVGRDGRCERRIRAAAQEDDRPGRRLQQRPLLRGDRGKRIRLGGEHGERLLLAVLARPQAGDGGLVAGSTGEVVAADPLDGDDGPAEQQPHGFHQCIVTARAAARQLRAAGGAADRLCVEPAVGRVVVLATAVGTELEPGHRRVRPVVGHGADDREPRPTLRAVDERVAIATISRVEQLAQAFGAGGDVGRDHRAPGNTRAGADREAAPAGRREPLDGDSLDPGERRRLAPAARR